ncbi:MAG: hypothetical protein L6Q66_13785, partial [Bacteroidia bacterium]|nr:hypothetical protein [Bacteroidia bacterium]
GGLIGCIVDGASGGCYDLTPEVLEVNLSTLDQTGYNEITVPSGRFEKLKELRFYDENKNLELTVNLK